MIQKKYPVTPDGRYMVVRGTLWRCTNPNLPEAQRQQAVNALMEARRAVKAHAHEPEALRKARERVQQAKETLGERGPTWWHDGAPCYNRHKAHNTPYAAWYACLGAEEKP